MKKGIRWRRPLGRGGFPRERKAARPVRGKVDVFALRERRMSVRGILQPVRLRGIPNASGLFVSELRGREAFEALR
jgi:hypothetical protein